MSFKKHGTRDPKGFGQYRVSTELEPLVIQEFLSALDCPRALTVAILVRNREYEQLAKLSFNPLDYASTHDLRCAYSATKFLSKYADFDSGLDLNDIALEKFEEFELLCRSTNNRFRHLGADPLYKGTAVWLHHAISRKISSMLGDFSWDEFFCVPDWGPGASTLIKRRDACTSIKFQFETGITRDLLSLVPLAKLQEVYPLWGNHLATENVFPTFVAGNKVTTVPKDSTTNRVIAIEPGFNLFFQAAIGDMIKGRLRRCGVDLRWQNRNQQLALSGSLTSKLATVDMSSASDSIAIEVVRELIPPDWFEVMDACRSHYGTRSGFPLRKWEKFSSMGNGFTFQLESLIFYAISFCCAEYLHCSTKDVSVYGDDIIVPTDVFELLSEVMSFYGFRINTKKSHYGSYFRESCGAHYHHGVNVKPIYFKSKLTSILSVYRLANAIRRLAYRFSGSWYGCDSRFGHVHHLLVQSVPQALRLWIPDQLGDGGFVVDFDKALPVRAGRGYEGFHVWHLQEVSHTHSEERLGYLLAELWRMDKRSRTELLIDEALIDGTILNDPGSRRAILKAIAEITRLDWKGGLNKVPYTGRVKLRLSKSIVTQWRDLGPWW